MLLVIGMAFTAGYVLKWLVNQIGPVQYTLSRISDLYGMAVLNAEYMHAYFSFCLCQHLYGTSKVKLLCVMSYAIQIQNLPEHNFFV